MDKAIVTVLLIICGVAATLAIFNGVYPALTQSQSAINSAAEQASDRMQSRIKVIEAGGSGTQVTVWVKNIGLTTIANIPQCDVFFGPPGLSTRIPYSESTVPGWSYSIPGGQTSWTQTVTISITIKLAAPLTAGNYLVNVVLPNGINDEITFGVN
jgi:archaeal flagellar protein FlaG